MTNKDKLPMSREELRKKGDIKLCEVSKKYRTAFTALNKLLMLRDAWGGGRVSPDNPRRIHLTNIDSACVDSISFPFCDKRDKFQETFADLIEEAKILL
jgi:hypothetical protein